MTIMFAKKWKFSVSFLLLLLLCSAASIKVSAASPHNFKNVKSQLKWPPEGQRLRFPITRDTSISSVGKERKGSNGGAAKVKLKGQQEFILFDFDTSPLKGRIITGALLHLRSASPEKAPLIRVGVSSIASPWEEGFSRWYLPLPGSACFLQAEYKRQDWAFPGSTFMNVSFGQGNTIWKFAECTPPDDENWQTFAVDPDVIAARMTGLSYGFSAYDEVGHTWSITDGKFEYSIFPNRFCCSRESGNSAPWIEIWANGTDTVPPDTVRAVQVKNDPFPPGEALVSWQTPEDHGGGKTLGFHVSCKKGNSEIPVPRYLIPMAEEPGQEVRMHIQDLPFGAGEKMVLSVSPVDSAGNIGRPFSKEVTLSKGQGKIKIPQVEISPFPPALELPEIKGIKIFITDMLDKVNPNTGQMIPPRPSDYRSGNHLYSASEKIIRLQSARNETIGFQLHVEGASKDTAIKIEYDFEQNPNLKPKVYRFGNVSIFNKKGKAVSELPDPLIPLKAESKGWKISESEKKYLSLLCELYIPHDEPSGNKTGRLSISIGKEKIEFSVNLNVWNFTLPNKLSFIPEMNAYGTVSPYKGYDYCRLAHEHRTCINRLPYGWSGQVEFAPEWNGSRFDWKKWDQKVSPLLDGTAFADLPREGEPVDVFYLPFNTDFRVEIIPNIITNARWLEYE